MPGKNGYDIAECVQRSLILNAMADAIHLVDLDLVIVWANNIYRGWLRMMKIDPDIIGLTVRQATPFLPDLIFEEYRRAILGEIVVSQETTSLPNGDLFDTETRKIPIITDGEVGGVITIMRDLTQQHRAAAELERYSHIVSCEMMTPLISMQKLATIVLTDYRGDGMTDRTAEILEQIINIAGRSMEMMYEVAGGTSFHPTFEPGEADLADVTVGDTLRSPSDMTDPSVDVG